jgi:DNA-binding NarL/FixJ family response regulator
VLAERPGVFRSGVASLLAEDGHYTVVEADDAEQLLAAARAHRPEVVLVDAGIVDGRRMPSPLRTLRMSAAAVIVWSFDADPAVAVAAVEAGADGFLHKDIAPAGLLRALDAALDGKAVLPRDIVGPLIERLRNVDESYRARELLLVLSPREREVLALVASGARNRAIASALEISEFTVKRHVQNILRKLGLPSRKVAAMLHRSATAGGIELPQPGGAGSTPGGRGGRTPVPIVLG